MSLEHLWAGWRSEYVTGLSESAERTAALGAEAGAGSGIGSESVEPEVAGDADAPAIPGATALVHGVRPGFDGDDPAHCVFCRIAATGGPSTDNLVVWRDDLTVAVLNLYPYASGHLLVMPARHLDDLGELTDAESDALWRCTRLAERAIRAAFSPEGLNLGANIGRAAGAGIPKHLHLHLVPRWAGDTNFMTAVSGVHVLPQTLQDTWAKLHAAWRSGDPAT